MSNVPLYPLPLVVPILACNEERRVRLFDESNYGEPTVSDQGSASGHRRSYNSFCLFLINVLINTSREKVRTCILLSLLVSSPTLVNATTYYVAPNGSNSNPGTLTAPFLTLQRAHDAAVAGDTIFMRGGTYNLNVIGQTAFSKSGTSGNTIKIFNYPGELPILDGSSVTNPFLTPLRMVNVSWWHIKGLEIKNAPYISISITGNSANITVENCIIHHGGRLATVGTGLKYDGTGGNNVFLNNDFHHNSDTIGGGNADGISVTSPGTSGIVLRGNRAWRNGDDGFDVWNSTGVLIENNWAWENGYDDSFWPLGDGQGFKLGGPGETSGGHTVKNNLAWKNLDSGFDGNGAQHPVSLYNNTGWDNRARNYRFWAQPNTFRNNIAFGSLGSVFGSDTFNSWTLGVTVSAADFSSLDDAIARGPRNADGSLPTSNFLRLVAGSDLIDRGVNVGIAYVGSAPDLGAYEYGGSVPPPPPPPSSSCTQTPLTVSSAFSDDGFSYMVRRTFGTPADDLNNPLQSTLRFFENGEEMGPAHALHSNIRNLGAGRFSHWSHTNGTGEALRLSASNNSDPRTNGRSYTYCVPVP